MCHAQKLANEGKSWCLVAVLWLVAPGPQGRSRARKVTPVSYQQRLDINKLILMMAVNSLKTRKLRKYAEQEFKTHSCAYCYQKWKLATHDIQDEESDNVFCEFGGCVSLRSGDSNREDTPQLKRK